MGEGRQGKERKGQGHFCTKTNGPKEYGWIPTKSDGHWGLGAELSNSDQALCSEMSG